MVATNTVNCCYMCNVLLCIVYECSRFLLHTTFISTIRVNVIFIFLYFIILNQNTFHTVRLKKKINK